MPLQFGKEQFKLLSVRIIILLQRFRRFFHVRFKFRAARHPQENAVHAFQRGIIQQPVLALHVRKHFFREFGEQVFVLREQVVHMISVIFQRNSRVVFPSCRQEMIVEHIRNHRRIFMELRPQAGFCFFHYRVCIGKMIDGKMQSDSPLHARRKGFRLGTRHRIRDEIPDKKFGIIVAG